jgi:hypothetical protein
MKTNWRETARTPALCPARFLHFKCGERTHAYEKFYAQGHLHSLGGHISFTRGLSRRGGTVMASTLTENGLWGAFTFSLPKGGAW